MLLGLEAFNKTGTLQQQDARRRIADTLIAENRYPR